MDLKIKNIKNIKNNIYTFSCFITFEKTKK